MQHINLDGCRKVSDREAFGHCVSLRAYLLSLRVGCPNLQHIGLQSFGQASDRGPSGIEHEMPALACTSTFKVASQSATRCLRRHCGMERTRQRPDPGRGAGERDCEPPQPHRPILRPLRVWGKNVGRQRHDAGCTTVPGPARRVGVCEIYYRVVGIFIHSVLEQNSGCTFRLKSQWGIPFFFFFAGVSPRRFWGKSPPRFWGKSPPRFWGKSPPIILR